MLDHCLNYLCERMNQSLRPAFDLTEDMVVVSPPADKETNGQLTTENRVLVFLSNLERDPFSKPGGIPGGGHQQRVALTNKPLYLTLSVVIAANFSGAGYTDGLKILSHLFAFFHRNPVLNHQNAPDLPAHIEQIAMEMESIPGNELSHMWSMLGSKYLPSAVYRVRLVVPDSETILTQTGRLGTTDPTLNRKDG
ncbi:hypothetical protein VA7868_01499 [Vibrio aerogenes CECT 7868]|uniref:Pvc16 N-terminal domain-containing protein n=1 Tax=Vibrio aerogenes CECT 7868 TaxID=1216006 RepID=A0A1M5Y4X8_9VIBR|nr:DUF4255 domain-containing protein [Vibrio aerogenes]SHI07111.1 hypothetical protein VA7868_01499 [Vibrio aerogenes CECT 7868]